METVHAALDARHRHETRQPGRRVAQNARHRRPGHGRSPRPPSPPPRRHPAGRTSSSSSAMTWGSPTWARSAARSGRRTSTALATRGRALHQLLHARELLAHAIHAADRRRYAPERPRQHGRVDRAQPAGRGRLRGLPQRPRRHAAAAAQGRRLPHLHGRQVAPGQGARPDPGRARLRARLLAARRGGQLLGHDELHRRVAEVGLHRGWALPDEAAQGLLRDEDLHRQADQLHRRQPRRRQAVLRLRRPPGAARSVPPAARMAQPPRRRVRQGLGRGAAGAAEAPDRARHHAGGHASSPSGCGSCPIPSCSRPRLGPSSARRWSSTPAWWRTWTSTSAG